MNENAFRQLIDDCTPSAPDPDAEQLAAALTDRLSAGTQGRSSGPPSSCRGPSTNWTARSTGHDLSGDSFLYTRAAVVAAGRDAYAAVLRDPRLFAPYAEDLVWAERLLHVPDEAYRRVTGEEWDRGTRHSCESCSNSAGWADA
ncbi:DUF4240 domain-containing protein [Streptomyces sp. NPDC056309]|uniref:DUF4240 domain-containing protein n=1 Tax=unclassified Streptomyces TaxID=2593676 RepID=UPI0035DBA955